MVGHKSFGRRGEPQRLIPREKAIEAVAQSTTVESTGYSFDPPMMLSKSPESSLLDDDLREWKRARKASAIANGNVVFWHRLLRIARYSERYRAMVPLCSDGSELLCRDSASPPA